MIFNPANWFKDMDWNAPINKIKNAGLDFAKTMKEAILTDPLKKQVEITKKVQGKAQENQSLNSIFDGEGTDTKMFSTVSGNDESNSGGSSSGVKPEIKNITVNMNSPMVEVMTPKHQEFEKMSPQQFLNWWVNSGQRFIRSIEVMA